ncbi:hypothetical protein MHBO_001314 [Bonamia ostreae]|uniref:Uncharacterized protein n=1 Tax=Bonamia ostreae TaxID=126728 RepID=A0ABV2AIH5_9EUKA
MFKLCKNNLRTISKNATNKIAKAENIKIQKLIKNIDKPVNVTRKDFLENPQRLKMLSTVKIPNGLAKIAFDCNRGVPFVPPVKRKVRLASGRFAKSVLYRNPKGSILIEDATAISPLDLLNMAALDLVKLMNKIRVKRASFFVLLTLVPLFGYFYTKKAMSKANWKEAEMEIMREEMILSVKKVEKMARPVNKI